MSAFKNIASGVGTVVTLMGIYKAQKIVAHQMKEQGYSTDSIASGRVAAVFVTSILIGGMVDKVINFAFDLRRF